MGKGPTEAMILSHPPSEQSPSGQAPKNVPVLAEVSPRHQAALDELHRALEERRALAVFIADGKFEASHVIRMFLEELDEDCAAARLTDAYQNAEHGMRDLIKALDFDPKDLSLGDLDGILEMFITFQGKHQRRTVIAIEQAHLQVGWLLDYVRELVEREAEKPNGLLIVLTGAPQLAEKFDEPPLASIRDRAGRRIRLPPLTLRETKAFLRQRAAAAGASDVSELFEFDAISRIHDLSCGIPDRLGRLCLKSLQFARQQGCGPVTAKIVAEAKKFLDIETPANGRVAHKPGAGSIKIEDYLGAKAEFISEAMMLGEAQQKASKAEPKQKLVVSCRGKHLSDFLLRRGRFLVGRADFADLHIDSKQVSRRHALLIKAGSGVTLKDLGSTNGTYLNGRRFKGDAEITVGDVIIMGDCRIECVTGKN